MRNSIRLSVPILLLACGAVSIEAQVQTNTPPAVPAKPKTQWKSSAAAGLTLTSGNSETTLATLTAETSRKTSQNEWGLGVDGTYGRSKVPGQTETTTTAELLHGVTQYNQMFTDRFYGLGRVEGKHDGVADLKYRVSLNLGVGYYLIKNTNTDLCAEIGPGYVFQQEDHETTRYASMRIGEKFHQALSEHARLWQTAECSPQVDDYENYVANAELGIEADLTKDKKITLRSYVTDTYNNKPAEDRKKNDVTWVTAIAYKF
jgi:putative salt-induced outer membrane protein YdiY